MVAENNLEILDTENSETVNGYSGNEPSVIYLSLIHITLPTT